MKSNEQILDECCFLDEQRNPLPKGLSQWVEWIDIKKINKKPENHHSYIVTDGIVITTGYWDNDEFVGYEKDLVNDVKYWMEYPKLPKD